MNIIERYFININNQISVYSLTILPCYIEVPDYPEYSDMQRITLKLKYGASSQVAISNAALIGNILKNEIIKDVIKHFELFANELGHTLKPQLTESMFKFNIGGIII
jgi:hypothetical protein